jgi:hypothetical protein
MYAVSRTPNACTMGCVESMMEFLRVRRLLTPTSSGDGRMRHWRTSACHRILSFLRILVTIVRPM